VFLCAAAPTTPTPCGRRRTSNPNQPELRRYTVPWTHALRRPARRLVPGRAFILAIRIPDGTIKPRSASATIARRASRHRRRAAWEPRWRSPTLLPVTQQTTARANLAAERRAAERQRTADRITSRPTSLSLSVHRGSGLAGPEPHADRLLSTCRRRRPRPSTAGCSSNGNKRSARHRPQHPVVSARSSRSHPACTTDFPARADKGDRRFRRPVNAAIQTTPQNRCAQRSG